MRLEGYSSCLPVCLSTCDFEDGKSVNLSNRYELTQEENLSPFNVPLSQISGLVSE